MKNITIIAADEGQNLKLAQQIKNQLDQLTSTNTLVNLISLQLPLYTISLEKEQGIPTQAKELYDQFTNSNGFFIVTPEYNGGIPPVLSNTIAWISRVNENWRASFNEKPAALASYSYTGAANLFIALRIQLAYMGLTVLGRTLSVTPTLPLKNPSLLALCKQLTSI